MSRFSRILATVCPSVPAPLQARCLAAMEGRDPQTPVLTSEGEAGVRTGQTTSPLPSGGGSGDGPTAIRPVPAQPETLLAWGDRS